jgi:tetratricopeptide (TPR) repeat protein
MAWEGLPMRIHPHDLLIQEFASTFPEEDEKCLEHLIQCADCQARLRSLLHPQPNALADKVVPLERRHAPASDYGPALDRVSSTLDSIEAAYEKERREAPRLFSELTQRPSEKWHLLVCNRPRFHTWGLCELVLRRGREQNFLNPALGERMSRLALEILDRLDVSYYGKEALEDLRARAWGYVANSRRIKADLRGAEEAFALAFASLKRGTQEPMDRAVLLDLQASLLRAQRRFGKALHLLRRASGIFLEIGERHRAGRVRVKMSTVHHFAGETEKAIPLLYEALELIDPAREPRLLLVAEHNLIDDLAEAGQFMEAQKMLIKARPLYQQFPHPWSQNPSKWVEGKIARGLGQRAQAEKLFLAARDGFLLASAAYDTALVSLDLASLYAEQGRMSDLKQVAGEMVPIFSSRQIHREALAALAYWRQAVEAERAGLKLVAGVASFLKRARYDPALRFEKPDQEM